MKAVFSSWQVWALLSASFAALTAVFAKVGVEVVDSNVATFVRTLVVVAMLIAILGAAGQLTAAAGLPARTYGFLALSGLATGASWLCYFRALQIGNVGQVAPVDKLSVVLVAVFGALFLGERPSGLNWIGIVLIAAGAALTMVKS
jgi:transporter family protein